MRRRDREVTDMNEILRILKTANVLHLGLTDGDMPYVLPMNYGFSWKMASSPSIFMVPRKAESGM